MKIRTSHKVISLLSFMLLFGCSDATSSESNYSNGYEEGYIQAQLSKEDEIQYYESLCDELGYLTYDMVYTPEMWRNYVCQDTGLYHEDYLCPEITKVAYITANVNFDNCLPCAICCPVEDYYFLDEETGIIHHDKDCLVLGTDDYESPSKNYRIVTKERALENGYTLCPKCCNSN